MPHQNDCYPWLPTLRVGYSSDPSGVGPLVGIPEAALKHYDCVAGHSTPQRRSTNAETGHG